MFSSIQQQVRPTTHDCQQQQTAVPCGTCDTTMHKMNRRFRSGESQEQQGNHIPRSISRTRRRLLYPQARGPKINELTQILVLLLVHTALLVRGPCVNCCNRTNKGYIPVVSCQRKHVNTPLCQHLTPLSPNMKNSRKLIEHP